MTETFLGQLLYDCPGRLLVSTSLLGTYYKPIGQRSQIDEPSFVGNRQKMERQGAAQKLKTTRNGLTNRRTGIQLRSFPEAGFAHAMGYFRAVPGTGVLVIRTGQMALVARKRSLFPVTSIDPTAHGTYS